MEIAEGKGRREEGSMGGWGAQRVRVQGRGVPVLGAEQGESKCRGGGMRARASAGERDVERCVRPPERPVYIITVSKNKLYIRAFPRVPNIFFQIT
jgi:hypothetical protein